MDKKKKEIIANICKEELSQDELMQLWEKVCDNNNYEPCYPMELFDELFQNKMPSEIVALVENNNFSLNDSYLIETIYGVESFNQIEDCPNFDYDEVARYLIESETLTDYFNEDTLIDLFADLYVPFDIETTKNIIENKYEDYFGLSFDINYDWDTLKDDIKEIIDHED